MKDITEYGIEGIDSVWFNDIKKIYNLCKENGLDDQFLMIYEGFYENLFPVNRLYVSIGLHNKIIEKYKNNDK